MWRPETKPLTPEQLSKKLFDTLINNNVVRAKELLEQGADVNYKDNIDHTLLLTYRNLSPEMVALFVEHNIDVNARDRSQQTALMKSTILKNPESVRLLIKAGARLDEQDNFKETPLLHAACSGHKEAVALLIEAGANLEIPDGRGNTPLLKAIASGEADLARLLIEAGADIHARNNDGEGVLYCACSRAENPEILTYLMDHGATDINAKDNRGQTPLMRAAGFKKTEKLRLLIEAGATLNDQKADGATALMSAVRTGYEESVQILLAAGADPEIRDEQGNTALLSALLAGHETGVRRLLEKGADATAVNKRGESALHCACKFGSNNLNDMDNSVLTGLVVDRVSDINAKDVAGNTALHWAAAHCADSIIQQLVDRGADVNIRNDRKQTPLLVAAAYVYEVSDLDLGMYGSMDFSDRAIPPMLNIAHSVIEKGIDLEARDDQGETVTSLLQKAGHGEAEGPLKQMHADYAVYQQKLNEQAQRELTASRQDVLRGHAPRLKFHPKM
jgi:ankyrin repeat protein